MECALPHLQKSLYISAISSMDVDFIQHPYPTSAIFIKCLLRKECFGNLKWSSAWISFALSLAFWLQNHGSPVQHGAGIKIMSAHTFLAFLGQLRFWMYTIGVARWNWLKILIPKHMWKSKIRLLDQKLDENRYVTFF